MRMAGNLSTECGDVTTAYESDENATSSLCQSFTNGSTNLSATNSSAGDFNKFYFYETETLTFLWILFILIMVGNLVVVATLFTTRARKSRTNFFIFHLAFADLAVGLISVLTDIIWKTTVAWNAGNVACKLVKFLQILVTYSSTYVLVALSIDRYDAITNPMNFSGSWRRARVLIASAWILSALFSLPYLVLYKVEDVGEHPECWIDLGPPLNWQIYIILTAISLFLLPAIIIAACYIIIVVTIWRKSHDVRLLTPTAPQRSHSSQATSKFSPDGQGRREGDAVISARYSRQTSSRGVIPKAKIKSVKMTFVIVSVFVLCWSPYFVFNLLQVFHLVPQTQTNIALSTFIQSLAPLNSAANPIIYCLFAGCEICTKLRRVRCIAALMERLFPCCACALNARDSTSLSCATTRYTYVSKRQPNVGGANMAAPARQLIVEQGRHDCTAL